MRMFNEHFPGWYGEFYRMFKRTKRKDLFELASLELVKECVRCRDAYNLPIVGFDLAGKKMAILQNITKKLLSMHTKIFAENGSRW